MNSISVKVWRPATLLIALVIMPFSASCQAGSLESPSNIECLERLEAPEYPPLPRTVRIEGIQTVKVLLSEQATVQMVESVVQSKSRGTDKDFREEAEKAVRNSAFSKTCGGKTITLIFHYEFRGDYTRSLFAFRPPNHFWIRFGPLYAQPAQGRKH